MTTPSARSYREITLTQGQVSLVEESDYGWLSRYKWYALWDDGTLSYYAVRNERYGEGYTVVRMHRQILGLAKGDPRHGEHRNHNTLDNRRSNIRIATVAQNNRNRRPPRNSISGVTGVRFRERDNTWYAAIKVDKKAIHLGCRRDMNEAIALRREAERLYFGDFACMY